MEAYFCQNNNKLLKFIIMSKDNKYRNSAKVAQQLIFKYCEERRKELNISIVDLANEIGVDKATLYRNIKGDSIMSLETFFSYLGALQIRPFFVPAEMDDTEYERMFFN